jgi:hypothetical protein
MMRHSDRNGLNQPPRRHGLCRLREGDDVSPEIDGTAKLE